MFQLARGSLLPQLTSREEARHPSYAAARGGAGVGLPPSGRPQSVHPRALHAASAGQRMPMTPDPGACSCAAYYQSCDMLALTALFLHKS